MQRHSPSAREQEVLLFGLVMIDRVGSLVSWNEERDVGLHLRWTLNTGPWAQSRRLVVSLCVMAEVQCVKAGMSGLMVDGGEGEWGW